MIRDDIKNIVLELTTNNRTLRDTSKYLILPLHGSMGTAEQKLIFRRPPAGVRKVITPANQAPNGQHICHKSPSIYHCCWVSLVPCSFGGFEIPRKRPLCSADPQNGFVLIGNPGDEHCRDFDNDR